MTRFHCVCVCLFLSANCFAQEERYELGQRLKAVELLWDEKLPIEDVRKRVAGPLNQSVMSFFSLRIGEAGRCLDDARFALLSDQPPANDQRWAASLSVRPQTRLMDSTATALPIELYSFYPTKIEAPKSSKLRLSLADESGKQLGKAVETPIGKLPIKVDIPVEGLGEGDYWLMAAIILEKERISLGRQRISRVSKPADRLKRMGSALQKSDKRTVTVETLRAHLSLLESLWDKKTLETDYPAARLFAEAESFVAALDTGNDVALKNRSGQYWLTLPAGAGRTAVRLFAPPDIAKNGVVPLVIALHGAGGSENMFFEGYGAGGIVKLCQKRGWLLVAPRLGLFSRSSSIADLIDEMAKLYPVDRMQVFLVGHSMGAAAAISTVAAIPDKVAAAAALGGGGRIAKPEAVKSVPIFIGCGSEDFAFGMARSLAKSLEKQGAISLTYKEYQDIEHLAVVQVALPDVFAFFDAVAKKK